MALGLPLAWLIGCSGAPICHGSNPANCPAEEVDTGVLSCKAVSNDIAAMACAPTLDQQLAALASDCPADVRDYRGSCGNYVVTVHPIVYSPGVYCYYDKATGAWAAYLDVPDNAETACAGQPVDPSCTWPALHPPDVQNICPADAGLDQ